MAKLISENNYRITLRVYPWIKKFLLEKNQFKENFVLTETSIVGLFLVSVLEDKKKYSRKRQIPEHTIPLDII
jgi:hypothetical protein